MRPSSVIRLLAFPLLACTPAAERDPVAERVDSAGVQLVTNRGGDRVLSLVFTPRLTLGGKDSGPEAFFRVVRGGVDVDSKGRIHVLDFEANTVAIFDSTGQFIRTLGRRGGGPGELQFPSNVRASDDGSVSVFDFSKDGLVRWGPDGSVMPSMRIKATSPARDVAFVDDGIAYTWTNYAIEEESERTVLQLERGDSVEDLAVIERPRPNMLEFKGCGIRMALPPLFAPDVSWATNGRRMAWVSGVAYEIAIREADGRRSIIRRDLAPREATLELARREVGDSMRLRGGTLRCALGPEEVADARGFASVIPAIRTMMMAPDGALWVQRTTPRTDPVVIDLFTADGDYRGTLPAGSPMPVAFFPNGDIAAAEKSKEDDVERLVVYRVAPAEPKTR